MVIRCVLLVVALLLASPAAAAAATVDVNTTADHNDKVCDTADCTLREAVELATNTVNLPKGRYVLSLGELVLAGDQIVGAGARASIIDGNRKSRVVRASAGSSSLDAVTVTGGNGDSTASLGSGGGVFVQSGAVLAITDSAIAANTATTGGGITAAGALVLSHSTVSGNTAGTGRLVQGGGITVPGTGSAAIADSTISSNTAGTIDAGTSQGGGIASAGGLSLNGVTISGNSAGSAAGLFESVVVGAPAPVIANTVIGGNNGSSECGGNGLDADITHNDLDDDKTCLLADPTDHRGIDPQLGPLADNGGSTNTHALLAPSPAIDQGNGCGMTDQRGVARPQAPASSCDIGAYEYRAPTLTVTTSVVNDAGGTAAPGTFNVHVRKGVGDVKGSPQPGSASGTTYALDAGSTYAVGADAVGGYAQAIAGGCASNGSITLSEGQVAACTIAAGDVAPTLNVVTAVINDDGGSRTPAGFAVHVRKGAADVAGSPKPGAAGGTTYKLKAGSYAVGVDAVSGYAAAVAGACTANGSVSLLIGQAKTCSVTENDVKPVSPPLPDPKPGKNVNALPRGTVTIKLPGSHSFVRLADGAQVPLGTVINAKKGRVRLVALPGGRATADFSAGIFKLGQTKGKKLITVLKLVEKLSCKGAGKAATAAKKKRRKRRLWGDGHGSFRTRGRHSAATVVGTKWLVEDRCRSTLTRVARGRVKVRDFVKKKTVIVTAGHRYVARRR